MTESLSVYTLQTGEHDRDRLTLLNRYLNPGSEQWLRMSGLSPGQRVLDVGCGQGQMTHYIAEQVGPSGRVVGVDVSEPQLAIARSTCRHPDRTEWVCTAGDRLTAVGQGFDLVYSRLLLMHVADPRAVLRAMVDALAPGGLLVVETGLVTGLRFVPQRPNSGVWLDWWFKLGDVIGASHRFPESAPLAIRSLGLGLEQTRTHQPVSFDRDAKLLHILGFEQLVPTYMEKCGATAAAVAEHRRMLKACLEDADTYVELYRMLQVCARKPALA